MFRKANTDYFLALKGRAAEMRHFPEALSTVFAIYMDASETHEQIKTALDMFVEMETLLDTHKMRYKLPEKDAARFEFLCFAQGQFFVALRRHYRNRVPPVHLFKYIPKVHFICHIGLYCKWINPRLGWCYGPEAFMQLVKRCVQTSSVGTAPAHLCSKVMQHYCMAFGHDLEES
jgi:hypothetical protein